MIHRDDEVQHNRKIRYTSPKIIDLGALNNVIRGASGVDYDSDMVTPASGDFPPLIGSSLDDD